MKTALKQLYKKYENTEFGKELYKIIEVCFEDSGIVKTITDLCILLDCNIQTFVRSRRNDYKYYRFSLHKILKDSGNSYKTCGEMITLPFGFVPIDHSTVLHDCNEMNQRIETEPDIFEPLYNKVLEIYRKNHGSN